MADVTATTDVTITNLQPIAAAGADQQVYVETQVTLDGSASTDPDGHLPLSGYWWQQTGGTDVTLSDPTAISPTFTSPPQPTVLTFTLVVTDSRGLASEPDEVVITVVDVPIDGLAANSNSPVFLHDAMTFTGTAITGTNVVYTWEFGDGNTGSGAVLDHTYGLAGTYVVTLTATNGAGSAWVMTTVVVYALPTLASLDINGPYAVGVTQLFSVTSDNPADGANYATIHYDFVISDVQVNEIPVFDFWAGGSWISVGLANDGANVVGTLPSGGGTFAMPAPFQGITLLPHSVHSRGHVHGTDQTRRPVYIS